MPLAQNFFPWLHSQFSFDAFEFMFEREADEGVVHLFPEEGVAAFECADGAHDGADWFASADGDSGQWLLAVVLAFGEAFAEVHDFKGTHRVVAPAATVAAFAALTAARTCSPVVKLK